MSIYGDIKERLNDNDAKVEKIMKLLDKKLLESNTESQSKKVLQMKIFHGDIAIVTKAFNSFMLNNDLEIYKIDTDHDNGYLCKTTLYYYTAIKNKG